MLIICGSCNKFLCFYVPHLYLHHENSTFDELKIILAALHFAGSFLGVVFINLIGGFLGFHFGWESIFYFSSMSNIFCIALWLYLVFDSPEKHPTITSKEHDFILKSRKGLSKKLDGKIPYFDILKSLPAWAMIIGHTTSNWGQYTILTLLPKYIADFQGFDVKVK